MLIVIFIYFIKFCFLLKGEEDTQFFFLNDLLIALIFLKNINLSNTITRGGSSIH